jgi:hypothetical protein
LVDLREQLLDQIGKGLLEEANRTVQSLISNCSDPELCNQTTLAALKKARILALIQRSHLQRRLRMVQASRLFHTSAESHTATWQIDG